MEVAVTAETAGSLGQQRQIKDLHLHQIMSRGNRKHHHDNYLSRDRILIIINLKKTLKSRLMFHQTHKVYVNPSRRT